MKFIFKFFLISACFGCFAFIGNSMLFSQSSTSLFSTLFMWITIGALICFWFWPLITQYIEFSDSDEQTQFGDSQTFEKFSNQTFKKVEKSDEE